MGTAMFYHQTRSTTEATVAQVATKALQAGWRVMVRSADAAHLARLDAKLWLGEETGFLPHGLAGGPHDADQPILLGPGPITNAAKGVMLLDGAEPLAGEAEALDRLWIIFDGADEAAVAHARDQWRRLTAEGIAAQYWSEEGGRWEKKAESNN